ncbi:50S ribosomal protein L4 [Candidatus Uhrbacteria bacterium CG_4_10_14_0_8_um_filter_58_22]|uniref:Large ribosomal subunit protein uL4 n=1 Tax=Candidatus Uhrbacteria bacterium CG_4_10_14_0_8_um_filter_58_22 TaxID=1975029 RepID=A0A2M7Q9J8_9BACT|nr:MAG: 50S ribosomal protein L4 [Parcubacteria group bacterium CG1_02_58_44]PIY62404.1 MAG: 50S ribosomal protein L4 [Candidatus Uhrbacteria bacterium CG_4_10_14_0_8_um_filter_58_22]
MPKVKIYNTEGKQVGEKDLRDDVFGVSVKPEVVHEVMLSMMANTHGSYAHTKTRGDVSGGGKKPWKQKGTGRARHGSSRSPIWVGGGVTFGPRSDRDYSVKVNRKTQRRAMMMTLSDMVSNDRLILMESFGVKDGKTREFAATIGKLPIATKKRLLAVSDKSDAMLRRSAGNIQSVTLRNVGDLGFLDVLSSEYLIMTPEAADGIEQKFTADKA